MNNDTSGKVRKPGCGIMLASGILLALYLALCASVGFLIRQQNLVQSAPSPTITPTPTSTPQVLITPMSDDRQIRYEDFSSDLRGWYLYYRPGKMETSNGNLILQAYSETSIVIATHHGFFGPTTETYFIQADFSTDSEPANSYGMVFGLNKALSSFYSLQIIPWNNAVVLLRYSGGDWEVLVPETPASISPYPEATTLSVSFREGDMKLYANGELAITYSDPNLLHSRGFGILTGGTGHRLIVDNLFVYDE